MCPLSGDRRFSDIHCDVLRLHLFEFGDQEWFPQIRHDAETAYLTAAYRVWPILARLWAERISMVLHRDAPTEILDLCSGSGGAIPQIVEELLKRGYDISASLTDLYPNPKSGTHPRIKWLASQWMRRTYRRGSQGCARCSRRFIIFGQMRPEQS